MPRPPSDRVEEGFQIWSTEANRNDTKTAALMGIPQETVSYWKRTYHWPQRFVEMVGPYSELLAAQARAEMRASLPTVAMRLRAIVADTKPVYNAQGELLGETWASSDRDAIQAAKLLAQYAFEDGAGQDSLALETEGVGGLSTRDPAFQALSPEDQSRAIIQFHMQSVNTRLPRRGNRV